MPSRSIQDLDERFQPIVWQFLSQCNKDPLMIAAKANVFLTCTWRSAVEQARAYAQGRTSPGDIITRAQPGQSPHNCSLASGKAAARAFDFAIEVKGRGLDWNAQDALWQRAIAIGIALGMVSGSTFGHGLVDNPHFEMENWKTA